MTEMKTITNILLNAAKSNRGINYIDGQTQEKFTPYQEVYARALGILYHFQSAGVEPGNELILLLSSNEQFIDAFWGSVLGKIVPVPVAAGISDEHRSKVFKIFTKLERAYVYTERKNLDRLQAFAEANNLNDVFTDIRNRTILVESITSIATPGIQHDAYPSDTAFIQFSSGSTSEPKGVVLTHQNLITNLYAISEGAKLTINDSTLSWMPLTHDMGLIGFHLTPMLNTIMQHLMPTELFIRRPMLWLEKATQHKTTLLCSPNFGYRHYLNAYTPEKAIGLDLSNVRLLFNGAEPISVSVSEEFLNKLAGHQLKRSTMFTVYGLAEASLGVTFPSPEKDYQFTSVQRATLSVGNKAVILDASDSSALSIVNLGKPVKDCMVKIAREDKTPAEELEIGHVCIKGKNVTSGYYQAPDINARVINPEGWLDTGDLGFMYRGDLYITGRAKDIIFINGQNYYPHDIEHVLTHFEEAAPGKAVACGVRSPGNDTDLVVVFVVYKGDENKFALLARQMRGYINQMLGIEVAEVIPIDRIPKTTSGKMQRYQLGDRFEKGEFNDVVMRLQEIERASADQQLSVSDLENKLLELCNEVIPEKKMSVSDNIFEIGTSSLALARIHEKIEEIWPGKLEVTDFFDYPTVRELAVFLESKLADQE